ncbi:AarF/UbiB family protein [Sphaerisporangium sp. TRM90804]|uniref:ABC1 kinase family protein n=1 Tax=Sphaerisporangium sp. TRM90804 TaxID=3031113 RepID=UPI00244A0BE8|nr:AarF/UbiB family protein [Sphaerisporangium sp. TRM90804]MDH2429188.1 AarF/UbiB family protein [Sphaerisporangium sp. TRM90804]
MYELARMYPPASRRSTKSKVPLWRTLTRTGAVVAVAAAFMIPALAGVAVVRVARGRDRARSFLYRRVVRMLQALGPTYVKFGQIASTRRDALPPELCDALSVLHDGVGPMSVAASRRALRAAYGDDLHKLFPTVDEKPVASGSIACVYRAVQADGRVVALKLKRPGVDTLMRADLDLVRRMVRLGERSSKMGGMPVGELAGYVSAAILGQLDFAKEAANSVRMRGILKPVKDVQVPALLGEHSRPECLVFDYIPDLDATAGERLPYGVRARLAATVLTAARKMMFVDGFVHCDLHPGNLYLTSDARVVILDAGYAVQIPDRVRRLMGEYWSRLRAGDGRRCGQIVLESAVKVGEETDVDAFVQAVTDLVQASVGSGEQFDMFAFGNKIFDLQREHGIYAASDFAFPLMSLLVLEGTVRGISPDVDFRHVGEKLGSGAAARSQATVIR